MARIRTIKPEFFLHEGLAELTPLHRLVFIGLWLHADRDGRLQDRSKRLRVGIVPYDALSETEFDAVLWDLAEHREGFIRRYAAEGDRFIAIPAFVDHQHIYPKEASRGFPADGETVSRGAPFALTPPERRITTPKPPRVHRAPPSVDDFIATLRTNLAYAHIDLDQELARMDAWLASPRGKGRKKSSTFILNWLNKIEKPATSNGEAIDPAYVGVPHFYTCGECGHFHSVPHGTPKVCTGVDVLPTRPVHA